MEPKSFLYKFEPIHQKKHYKESYQTLKDLGLNRIIRDITNSNRKYNFEYLFLEPLSYENIQFRLDVFRDLENPEILSCIRQFVKNMDEVERRIIQIRETPTKDQKYWYFASLTIFYVEMLKSLYTGLITSSPKSEAINNLLNYLHSIFGKEQYYQLKNKAKDLLNKMASLNYTLKLKGDFIEVLPGRNAQDYSHRLKQTFQQFQTDDVKDYTFKRLDNDYKMNNLEEEILAGVKHYYPEPFVDLNIFYNQNQNFRDDVIDLFYREIQFYLTYLDYINPIKESGLPFCIPIFSDIKDVQIINGFEMNLVQKQHEHYIVLNDFTCSDKQTVFIITGANQGGKTTFTRMIGQIFYLASIGLPVPAQEARVFLTDHIYTHFEQEESVYTGNGKLKDDLIRTKQILDRATSHSLIILNEVFSSTTVEDAIEISKEILKRVKLIDCICLFVTFLNELTEDEEISSLVSQVINNKRTFKIKDMSSDGMAYALAIAEKYHLTYDKLKLRLNE